MRSRRTRYLLIASLLTVLLASFDSSFAMASSTSNTIAMPLKDIQRFATAVAQIKRYYVEPVSDDKLFDYAIQGMLSNLDPHSAYLDADALQDLQTSTTGEFAGIGIEMIPDKGFIRVISPIDDTPAYKAGIKPGDLIIRINNKLVQDMTLREAINLIRGKPGSTVQLTVFRKNEKKPLNFMVKREIIKIKAVKSKLLEKGYGYIRVAFFQTDTNKELLTAIQNLKQQSGGRLNGLVLDLRDDPGGLLDSAIEVADDFLNAKNLKGNDLIVYTKGRIPADDIKAKATPGEIVPGVPLIVLINQGSASASEIVAGALQDHKRAIIMGTKSFGKGSVQTVLPISYNTAIKLTTALYYTPSGRSIQAKGIEPDIVVSGIKIPKSDDDYTFFDIQESDLNRHLNNGNGESNTQQGDAETQNQENTKTENKLLHTDFQLYEALNLLKALHAMKNTQA